MVGTGLPVRQFEAEGIAELACIKPQVGRVFGGRGVVGGGNWLDGFRLHPDRLAGLDGGTDDVPGVVAPVGFAAGDAMIGAVGEGLRVAALLADEVGGDDIEAVTIRRQIEHDLGEVAAVRADHPTGAQDQVARVGGLQRPFAVALALAVDALRVGGVVFTVGSCFVPSNT